MSHCDRQSRYNRSPKGKACKERYRASGKLRAFYTQYNARRRSNPTYREWEAIRHQCYIEAKVCGKPTRDVMDAWGIPQWSVYRLKSVDYSAHNVDEPSV